MILGQLRIWARQAKNAALYMYVIYIILYDVYIFLYLQVVTKLQMIYRLSVLALPCLRATLLKVFKSKFLKLESVGRQIKSKFLEL